MDNAPLIDQIVNDVIDTSVPVSTALMKAYVLASRLGNNALIEWVNNEMKGYSKRRLVPSYRITGGNVHGTITDGYNYKYNVQLPIASLGKEYVDALLDVPIMEGVEALEKNLMRFDGSNSKFIGKPLGVEMCHEISKNYKKGIRVTEAWSGVGEVGYNKVYSAIRGHLLELVMKIENELVNSGGKEALIQNRTNKELQHNITNFINSMNISANGTGNVINTGNDNTFTVTNNIQPGNMASLKEALASHSVPTEDIEELEAILLSEPHQAGNALGPATSGWIGKMFSKSLSGVWQVASGTAANLLAPMISAYLGMPLPLS